MKSLRIAFASTASIGGAADFGFGARLASISGNGHGGSKRGGRFPLGHYKKMNVAMARRAVAAKWNSEYEK